MSQHQLEKYVTDAHAQGMSHEEIVASLTKAGWRLHDFVDIVLERTQPESADALISVRNVTKKYNEKVTALNGVSFSVKKGGVTALLGPNGAGKTTLVRMMSTLLSPTSGRITVAGYDVVRDAKKLRSEIGLTGQYAAVDDMLTGRENLEMVGRLYHIGKTKARARASELLKQFDLEDAADRTLKTYSGGMRRRLDLAASLIMHPKVLFLDEPTTGLDPRSRFALWNVIRDLVKEGTTVLLTTQYLEEADQLADAIFVIDHGRIIAQGTADELKTQVGGDVLEIHMTEHAKAGHAAEVIRSFGSASPSADENHGIVTMPVAGGASVLVEVVRKLDAEKLAITNIVLRRPSLDDVFMKLTGHTAG
jgi:ABC-2 type transport system ATP-binding protein